MEFATAVGCAHHLQCSACNWAVHEEEPILRLDVSVDEAVLVHVVDRPEHLLDDDRANLLCENFLFNDLVEELSAAAELHDQVVGFLVLEPRRHSCWKPFSKSTSLA